MGKQQRRSKQQWRPVRPVQALCARLLKRRRSILNHWTSGRQTNAPVEGFNLKAKLVKRAALRFQKAAASATNDRLRLALFSRTANAELDLRATQRALPCVHRPFYAYR